MAKNKKKKLTFCGQPFVDGRARCGDVVCELWKPRGVKIGRASMFFGKDGLPPSELEGRGKTLAAAVRQAERNYLQWLEEQCRAVGWRVEDE